ncbi:hypothetical protein RRG08_003034 [Elysia crispata]|uniref:Uncharacterized protein n=1 Tax=Elysia crispata TaxID=231223 RepID=A0AAE1EB90_9GAST|nr:hypothetical protein RRG08_003034 [Elysia crispata]
MTHAPTDVIKPSTVCRAILTTCGIFETLSYKVQCSPIGLSDSDNGMRYSRRCPTRVSPHLLVYEILITDQTHAQTQSCKDTEIPQAKTVQHTQAADNHETFQLKFNKHTEADKTM